MTWTPVLDQEVWFNYPDSPGPMGKVIAFVPAGVRVGQPIIRRPDGSLGVVHPMFLLPFRYGGEEWQAADREGCVQ